MEREREPFVEDDQERCTNIPQTLLDAWQRPFDANELKVAVGKPRANRPLRLTAGRQANVTLPIHVDRHAEREAVHPAGHEDKLI